jgi:hypothetical protein
MPMESHSFMLQTLHWTSRNVVCLTPIIFLTQYFTYNCYQSAIIIHNMYQMLIRYSERDDDSIITEMRLPVKFIIMTSVTRSCWKT